MDYVPLSKSGRLWDGKMDIFKAFRKASAAGAGESITALYDPTLHRDIPSEPDLRDLNIALAILVDIFPDAEPETLRAMLSSVSESSRVEIVTEQMLKNDAKKMRGSKVLQKLRPAEKSVKRLKIALATEETFRSDVYKKAVKQVLYQEFRSLSHSSIKAVLAEQNYSYTGSRPVLQQLVAKSWRFSLSNMWSRQPSLSIEQDRTSISRLSNTVGVKRTGSSELDQELHDLLVVPILQQRRHDQLTADYQLASQLNEADAREAEALFDCECCYGSVAFERLAICDDGCHTLCFDCVRRSAHEALYGQGWAQAIDLSKSTLRCFAPASELCHGTLPNATVRRALSEPGGEEDVWDQLQTRMTSEALLRGGRRDTARAAQRCKKHMATYRHEVFGDGTGLYISFLVTRLGLLHCTTDDDSRLSLDFVQHITTHERRPQYILVSSQQAKTRAEVQMRQSSMQQDDVYTLHSPMARPSYLLRERKDIFAYYHRVISHGGGQAHMPALST
ncbi:hypothetical protein LTR56_003799 [Elasticomyces elasticus]|nr:hypothetical protein LTR22_013141 [Elasticomyces elasticus]KAK3654941.1 hypothetical protein LTR56_003799 [Elasticomyces elasticus]KAK4928728.1 hypothetical protein LTR49_004537 [Elasticomyces elasticus]KAK5766645.1 hypothetical protein LTS12_003264 [Elasticomyces elasticus]